MTTVPRAADLPVGSQVGRDQPEFTKDDALVWRDRDGNAYSGGAVDYYLSNRGYVVLRVGDGTEN